MLKAKPFVAVADSHGDEIDPESDKAVMEFIQDFKPVVRLHLGDAFNFAALRKGASPEDQAISIQHDWEMGCDFMRRFFAGGKENFYLEGNHDRVRLEGFVNDSNALKRDAAIDGIKKLDQLIARCRCKTFPYDSRKGYLKIGHLGFIHGYASGIGATAKHARIYGNVLAGHGHQIDCIAVEAVNGPQEARMIGAMCRTDMPYNSRHLAKLRHANGFAYGHLFENGEYQVFQARKIGGKFYAANQIQTY